MTCIAKVTVWLEWLPVAASHAIVAEGGEFAQFDSSLFVPLEKARKCLRTGSPWNTNRPRRQRPL